MVKNGFYKNCLNCHIFFYTRPFEIKDGKGKFCSKKCHYLSKRSKPNKICSECKKLFIGRPKSRFCSRKCRDQSMRNGIIKNCLFCNKEIYIRKGILKINEGKYCSRQCYDNNPKSIETRRKNSEAHKGEKSATWKGGITPIHKILRGSLEYKIWRDKVFERDNYRCIWCGAKTVKGGRQVYLNADHIKPFALYPELRFEVSNGRTLCVSCHKKTPTYGAKIRVFINKSA